MPTNDERNQYERDKEARARNLEAAQQRMGELRDTDRAHDRFKLDRPSTDIAAKPTILGRRKDDHTKWDRVS